MILTNTLDGFSIPFFSVSRTLHSRTVSVTRTWTSRQNTAPDWLLWARRTPGPDASGANSISHTDVERGTADSKTIEDAVVLAKEGIKPVGTPPVGVSTPIGGTSQGSSVMTSQVFTTRSRHASSHDVKVCPPAVFLRWKLRRLMHPLSYTRSCSQSIGLMGGTSPPSL